MCKLILTAMEAIGGQLPILTLMEDWTVILLGVLNGDQCLQLIRANEGGSYCLLTYEITKIPAALSSSSQYSHTHSYTVGA